jgi:hypothetical protein
MTANLRSLARAEGLEHSSATRAIAVKRQQPLIRRVDTKTSMIHTSIQTMEKYKETVENSAHIARAANDDR